MVQRTRSRRSPHHPPHSTGNKIQPRPCLYKAETLRASESLRRLPSRGVALKHITVLERRHKQQTKIRCAWHCKKRILRKNTTLSCHQNQIKPNQSKPNQSHQNQIKSKGIKNNSTQVKPNHITSNQTKAADLQTLKHYSLALTAHILRPNQSGRPPQNFKNIYCRFSATSPSPPPPPPPQIASIAAHRAASHYI